MNDTFETLRALWGALVDHFPTKAILSALTGLLVSVFGPIDFVLQAFGMALMLSLVLVVVRYLQAWMDPAVHTEDSITEQARKWSQRWIGYLIIAGMGYQISILFHMPGVRDGFMAFGVITEFGIMIATLEDLMGVSLDPLRQKLQLFFKLVESTTDRRSK